MIGRDDLAPREQAVRDRWEQVVRRDPDVTGSALAVLLVMATYGNRDGTSIHIGVDRLADDVGVSSATVRRAIDLGRRLGYIERVARGHHIAHGSAKPSEYALRGKPTAHPCAVEQEPTAHAARVGSEPTAHLGRPNRSNGPSQPLTTHSLPSSTKDDHVARAHARLDDQLPDQLDADAAIWSETHPGREREALAAALEFERGRGMTISSAAAYFGTWTRERRGGIQLPRQKLPQCPDCHGDGWITDDAGKILSRCAHPQRASA